MTLPAKWADRKERPKFTHRVGLAQPVLAAGVLTFFALLLGLPILYLINGAFDPAVVPAKLMADYRLGQSYNTTVATLDGLLSPLIDTGVGSLTLGGILTCAFGFAFLAWAIAMTLVSQWRTQLPVLEVVEPLRFFTAFVITLTLLSILFWLGRQAGDGVRDAGALALAIFHFGFGFVIILSWYYAITGSFVSWRSLLMTAFTVSGVVTFFVWVLGYAIPAQIDDVPLNILIVVGHLFGLWLIIVLGVHSLARETLDQSDWQDLDALSRGQQVDFGLAIMKTLGDDENRNRWITGHTIAQRLGAKHPITVQALQRLNEHGLIRGSRVASRPDHWRLSTESLHGLNLQELMEAFGATLNPNDGVYEEGPQQALLDLADQERRVFRTDLASLTRADRGPALTSDAPAFLSLISDRGIGTHTDAAGAPPAVTSPPKAYERLTALFEGAAAAQSSESSQLTEDFPAFNLPPKPSSMERTKAAAQDSEETEEGEEADLNEDEAPTVTSPISERLSQLSIKDDTARDGDDGEEGDEDGETKEKAPRDSTPKNRTSKTDETDDQVEAESPKPKKKKPAVKKKAKAVKSTENKGENKKAEPIDADTADTTTKPMVSTGLTSLVK